MLSTGQFVLFVRVIVDNTLPRGLFVNVVYECLLYSSITRLRLRTS